MVARAALVAAALVIGVWLAVALRAVQLQNDASAASPEAGPRPAPAEFDRARALYKRSERLTPSSAPELGEGGLLLRANRLPEAAAVLERIVRHEPANVPAETALYLALQKTDPAAAAEVLRRIRALAPPAPAR